MTVFKKTSLGRNFHRILNMSVKFTLFFLVFTVIICGLQILGNSQKEYERIVITFSIKHQLRYRGNLVRHILKAEKRYYERIVAFSKDRLMLYPYHLADMVCKGLRITPFIYYISIVEKLIQLEKSYDFIPNFTAADCKN